jgi:hypothetical protein
MTSPFTSLPQLRAEAQDINGAVWRSAVSPSPNSGFFFVIGVQKFSMHSTMLWVRSDHAKCGSHHASNYVSALDGQSTVAFSQGNGAI